MPARLTPIEPPAADAILTGDSRRAFALAGELMVQPRMSHQARGLWGYTGETAAGPGLTVQSTGSGGPSAVAVLGDLAGLGVKRAVRLGSCVTPAGCFALGTVLLVKTAIGGDGASRDLHPGVEPIEPDPALARLLADLGPAAVVSSHDIVARFDPRGPRPAEGADVRDLQTAAILAGAKHFGIEAAAVLVVAGDDDGDFLPEADLTEHFTAAGLSITRRLDNR